MRECERERERERKRAREKEASEKEVVFLLSSKKKREKLTPFFFPLPFLSLPRNPFHRKKIETLR